MSFESGLDGRCLESVYVSYVVYKDATYENAPAQLCPPEFSVTHIKAPVEAEYMRIVPSQDTEATCSLSGLIADHIMASVCPVRRWISMPASKS